MIKEMRTELAGILSEALTSWGFQAYPTWPNKITSRSVFVRPGTGTYATGGQFQGDYIVSLDVVIVTNHASNEKALDELDDLLEVVLQEIADSDYKLQSVDEPGLTPINGIDHMTIALHISKPGKL